MTESVQYEKKYLLIILPDTHDPFLLIQFPVAHAHWEIPPDTGMQK